HILAAITRRVRDTTGSRKTIVVGENEPQDVRLLRASERGGFGLDALWNDDFHHTAHVALTGRREAHYSDHLARGWRMAGARQTAIVLTPSATARTELTDEQIIPQRPQLYASTIRKVSYAAKSGN